MRHGMDHRKLGRKPAHRKALLRNLMNALVRSERIETTVEKAKELRRLADRLITLGKRETTHARRRVFSLLSDKANTEKLFAGLAGRFRERQGGYTRIVRTGYRIGDGAEMAIIEYLPLEEKKAAGKKGAEKKTARKKAAPAKKAAAEGKAAKTEKKPAAKKKTSSAPRAAAKPKKTESEKSPGKTKTRKKKTAGEAE
ncbi:MAG TPA: 50S ribosomal protein L17 [Deltaproteobacteria bacterium]|nr:MAG: 50S ribosomal protein L17 [Deltaproteobacteria bacterium GWC2_65_14]HBO70111.1 50S ribosomal protein L17 [Deltaproteobacteria bacterium]